ncbi:serine protease [Amycolatopsis rhabdoformis]|uniref:Serine protease n=1 Tax=Amycolatopsis rhabdoformis TaxID=1448059 RepID=A0ABZ1IJL3_9PSEU|nr:serine protease [Amycolatopsis rhabdoformis]WSE34031.1 serine protease [Amycolatopsis rhabdoformis]
MRYQAERKRWRVRLSDRDRHVHGAGTVLDEDHVLTCAHVVEEAGGAGAEVLVDFVGVPGARTISAKVVPECWFPAARDERGDIAVLRLAQREPGALAAPLHRRPLVDGMRVRAYGFPPGSDEGLWWQGRIVGEGGPGCEWVQLARDHEAQPITHGFSGTAVLAEDSGLLVGMVVSRFEAEGDRVAWMIPVETVLGYVRRWGQGSPAVDVSLGVSVGSVPYDEPFAREFAGWLRAKDGTGVWVVVTGEAGSARAAALELAVVLADRERAAAAGALRDSVPEEAVPPSGSVDLAVDAAGKSVEEIRRRIAERFEESPDTGRRTVVVTAIDDAAEPGRLVDEVIGPLADHAERLGVRLALGFRRETSPGLSVLRSRATDGLASRLATLQQQVADLAALEEQVAELAPRFAGEPRFPARAHLARAAVNRLRSAVTARDLAWAERHFDGIARLVSAYLAAAQQTNERLDARLARRTELRFRLDGYGDRARTTHHGENPLLDALYEKAWRQLHEGPCDLATAAAAVEEFGAAVRGEG